jgi:hypothetical protein
MMFGTIVVSMSGIALPILAGVLLMPKGEGQPAAASRRGAHGPWLLLRQCRLYLGSLSAAARQRHLHGSVTRSSTVRYG